MYRLAPLPATAPARRRGAILIVVLAMLALFAVIGLGFVFYADSEANIARLYKDAQAQPDVGPPDGTAALNQYLSAFIYDVGDYYDPATATTNPADLLNALRGHSLARSMYGWFGTGWVNPKKVPTMIYGANAIAFNGVGEFDDGSKPSGIPYLQVVNHTFINGTVIDPERAGSRAAGNLPLSTTFVGKNAGYTYPDKNNFYLASLDPRTGEVLVPSFHRPWLFGSLDPTNANWTSAAGRLKTLRPRPADNTSFPYVPQNADGTYTGDVQNLVGGYVSPMGTSTAKQFGFQRNDSLWMDIGLKPFLWNGKTIKALVAPLVVDLDGRVNLSVAGQNRPGDGNSFGGYGPWEINPAKLLPTAEATAIVTNRLGGAGKTPKTQGGTITNKYFLNPVPGVVVGPPLPTYSQVNWGRKTGTAFALPNGTSLLGMPTYTNFDDNTNTANHPALFAASEWPTTPTTTSHTFPVMDTRRLSDRYADVATSYTQMTLAPLSITLQGTSPVANRTDAGNPLRMETTTLSASLDVPMVPPMMLDYSASKFQLNNIAAGNTTSPAAATLPHPSVSPTTSLPAVLTGAEATPKPVPTSSDVDFANRIWANRMAILGGVDLNRKLTDYRADTTQHLSAWNVSSANYLQAWADRHNLARDIFARLIIATGANASVDVTNAATLGSVTIPAGVTAAQKDALQYLAQLAANIVDQIDGDDISTTFVWNPTSDMTGGAGAAPHPLIAVTPAILTNAKFQANFATIASIQSGVVFGTEKPRLVVNEVYSEFANDPNDTFKPTAMPKPQPPTKPVQTRFWIELVNPGVNPYPGSAANNKGPLGDGSVQLLNDAADAPGAIPKGSLAFAGPFSPYQVQVIRANKNGQKVLTTLQTLTNVKGDLSAAGTTNPDIQIDFGSINTLTGAPGSKLRKVVPNQGQYPVGANNGFVVLAPNTADLTAPSVALPLNSDPASALPPTAAVIRSNPIVTGPMFAPSANQKPQDALAYLNPLPNLPPNTGDLQTGSAYLTGLREHVVVLRRLANPYLPPNDPTLPGYIAKNPINLYITVDFLNSVPSMDAVYMAGDSMAPRQPKPTGTPPNDPGYDPMTPNDPNNQRYSVGRVQPLAGYFSGTTVAPAITAPPTFPTSFLLIQKPKTPPGPLGGEVNHTLGRHNGTTATLPPSGLPGTATETIVMPFDWLVHYDRPLSNPLELLQVSCRKPHELTQLFVPKGAKNAWKPNHTANWIAPVSGVADTETTGLYRALELLRVKPWDYSAPMGGKVYGRINLNSVQDTKIFSALLDPQPGNLFTATDVTNIGNALILSRTTKLNTSVTLPDGVTVVQGNVPGQTVAEGAAVGTGDLPFHSLGAAQQLPAAKGFGIRDTILRSPVGTLVPTTWVSGNDTPGPPPSGQGPQEYLKSDAARKMFNNTTTVSNTFAVWVTVGFFEVDMVNAPVTETAGVLRYKLKQEVYLNVPGDIRQQYFAIVDRTNLTLDPTLQFDTKNNVFTNTGQGPRPAFTQLEDGAAAGATTIVMFANGGSATGPVNLYADGQAVPVNANTTLFVGTGPMAVPSAPTANATPQPVWATNREPVKVKAITAFDATTGRATITLTAALKYAHPAGTLVTNAVPGNPGPQPNFDHTNGLYWPVVPYVTRVK